MENMMTPNTHMVHSPSKWDKAKTLCGRVAQWDWIMTDKLPTCAHCLSKIYKKRKFVPTRK